MRIYNEINIEGFEFWASARQNAEKLTSNEFKQLDFILEDLYPDGMTETELKDLFWFDFPTICEWLGLEYDEEKDEIIRQ